MTGPGGGLDAALAAELAAVEQQATQLAALALAARWQDILAGGTTKCQAAELGLGLCEACQLGTDTLAFLTDLSRGAPECLT